MKFISAILSRMWPRRLAGQMIGLLLTALIMAQVTNFLIFMDERRAAIRSVERTQVLERTASLIRLIESSPPSFHGLMVEAASSRKLYFWFSETSPISKESSPGDSELGRRLEGLLGQGDARDLRIRVANQDRRYWGAWPILIQEGVGATKTIHSEGIDLSSLNKTDLDIPKLLISTRLHDGRWLNVGMGVNPPFRRWALPTLLSMALAGGSICVIVVLMVRRITRPLTRLAQAAEQVGRGEKISPISEEGPTDVRQTVRAFNRMYERLQRFVQDRTRLLAAISHDLRTPITSLRLRAELIEDTECRTKILETLKEMQEMTEATLAFARDEATTENSHLVDLTALIDSLCEDCADLGMRVSFEGGTRTPYSCRPVSLKRAIRNLVENAVAYGDQARVALEQSHSEFRVLIHDTGPGIPETDFERVFHPFVRLEESRSHATGGIGLGMAIARSIVRNHGGDITLANCREGGLLATIHLPRSDSSSLVA